MNNVNLIGRLTKDPELRQSRSGTATLKFTLAVDRRFKQQGQPDADFINCLAFGKSAETIAQYCRKGNKLAVTGRIQTGSYEKQDGSRVYTFDVVVNEFEFLTPKSENKQQQPYQQQNFQQPYNQQTTQYQQQGQPITQNPYQQPVEGKYGGYGPEDTLPLENDDLPF
ncbi:single-stranded DNA-binding protein [Faecalibaculum rodentium]|uniref:single-stranded DNA-binding protein n=2 Tax=Faecalibaculum rodentium TaxID=1702221 RepID=UPI0025B748F4|nr:single-stranded DNA-binding protein [Faecalibaculum rodentium]